MRRSIAVALLLACFGAPLVVGAEDPKEGRAREVPHYESPLLSLLLLPVNLLIRMASIASPQAEEPAKDEPRGE